MTAERSGGGSLRVWLVGAEAWVQAVETIHGGVVPREDADLLLAWEAAGIVNAFGEVDPHWAQLITLAQDATTIVEVVSTFGDVVFLATLLLTPQQQLAVCVTSRATFTVVDGRSVIDAGHPMVEIASSDASAPWVLLKRVLPPVDNARAEPVEVDPRELRPVTLDPSVVPVSLRDDPVRAGDYLTELARGDRDNVPALPPDIAQSLSTTDGVFAVVLGSRAGATVSRELVWSIGEHLFRLDPAQHTFSKVPPGDIGGQLISAIRAFNKLSG